MSPLLKPFSVSVFGRLSVDDRRKRIKMYAFSNENVLGWMGSQSEGLFSKPRYWAIFIHIFFQFKYPKFLFSSY